jgi:K+-sensing histidine kinase KdpD
MRLTTERRRLNRSDTSTRLQLVAMPVETEVLNEKYWVVLVPLARVVGSGCGGCGLVSVRYAFGPSDMTVIGPSRPNWVATVAHELRGPLSALETASELLDRDFDSLDATQIRSMISGIHRRALWMRGLMENLLCSAAVSDGRFTVNARPLDVVDLAHEIEAVVRPLLDRKQQRLVISAPTTTIVHADTQRISQVLLNLISNAHKYSDAGTEIEIEITTDGSVSRVRVSDRGPGLPPGKVRSAFRAYDRAGRTDGEGLGIGLWVVRSIVLAHGGTVGALNRAGGGATFWFELRNSTAVRLVDHALGADVAPKNGFVGVGAA